MWAAGAAAARGGGATFGWVGCWWRRRGRGPRAGPARPGPSAADGTFPERRGGSRRPHPPGRPGLQPVGGRSAERRGGGGFLWTEFGLDTSHSVAFASGFLGRRAESEAYSELKSVMPPIHSLFRRRADPLKSIALISSRLCSRANCAGQSCRCSRLVAV